MSRMPQDAAALWQRKGNETHCDRRDGSQVLLLCACRPEAVAAQRAKTWCFSGSLLCRGSNSARSLYDHTAVPTPDGTQVRPPARVGGQRQRVALPTLLTCCSPAVCTGLHVWWAHRRPAHQDCPLQLRRGADAQRAVGAAALPHGLVGGDGPGGPRRRHVGAGQWHQLYVTLALTWQQAHRRRSLRPAEPTRAVPLVAHTWACADMVVFGGAAYGDSAWYLNDVQVLNVVSAAWTTYTANSAWFAVGICGVRTTVAWTLLHRACPPHTQ